MSSLVANWQAQAHQTSRRYIICLFLALGVCVVLGLSKGALTLHFSTSMTQLEYAVLWDIRAPRVFMTVITGAGLALCGALLQAITRNPLADPGIVGVSSFAALFAAFAIFVSSMIDLPAWLSVFFTPAMAFIGAVLALILLMLIAGTKQSINTLILILTGVALNAGAQTLLGFILYLADDQTLRAITFWQLGSYSGIHWMQALFCGLCVAITSVFAVKNANNIMLLQMGEQHARFQGVAVNVLKRNLLLFIALVTAVCVCFTGIVGFVGLVVPHIARIIVGAQLSILLPCSMLIGACLVTFADMVSRTVVTPSELPIGLLTSALGVPFFLSLIFIEKRKYTHD